MAITDDFTGLPIGLLICQPIIEVAKGQAELCNVYLDQLFRLAFKTMPDLTKDEAVEARTIKFKLNRTVVDAASGATKPVTVEVEAPLLALVPIPAFTMEEATVNFTMEVKDSTADKITDASEGTMAASLSIWGFSSTISGKVTTSRETRARATSRPSTTSTPAPPSSPPPRAWQSSAASSPPSSSR